MFLVAVARVGEWLSLVEHLVRDTTEHKDLKSKPLIRRCFSTRDPDGNLLRLVPLLSPNSVVRRDAAAIVSISMT
ncbi:hypothetical protein SBA1_1100006 [Candidatus Sulfotelmatobacter kueseliae]|uniref:Uncharacterized protein n=1 Tax=Candidatus Sulfotelmatobacter kueseliae TaxID=2042962 RepID=A0A2U3JZV9_9BACT|nr:hypothetical protein SBA1_1100006 [Candidatus Sulfotelmatobacter kueseliae]